jgi:hypothetical protein
MPGSTARLADVGAVDPQPLEPAGVGKQPSQQLAVVALHPGALGEHQPRLGDAVGKRVADLLHLTEAEHARARRAGGDAALDLDSAEGGGDQAGELMLELPDLAAQIATTEALVDLDPEDVPLEQFPHQLSLRV